MDGLALAAVVSEIAPCLRGARLQGVKEPLPGLLTLTLRGRSTRRLLLAPNRAAIHLTTVELPPAPDPSPFVMLLRKSLRGARLVDIEQCSWDRIVRLEFRRAAVGGPENAVLVAELLGVHGNLVQLREGIVAASWRARPRLAVGEPYRPPARQPKLDPRTLTANDLLSVLADTDPVRALVRAVDGIGSRRARDLLDAAPDAPTLASRIAQVSAASSATLAGTSADSPCTPFPLSDALDRELASDLDGQQAEDERTPLRRRLRRGLTRRERAIGRVTEWLAAADPARLRREAELLLAHAADVPRGAARVELEDPRTGGTIAIQLDPAVPPIPHAESLFRRARRLDRGILAANARQRRLGREARLLRSALEDLADGRAPFEEALALVSPPPRPRAKREPQRRLPMMIDGHAVEVGRSAAENDALLRRAAPHDIWLHAKGAAGSHVIVHRGGRQAVPDSVVEAAARLAVRHSKLRGERRAEVTVAEVRNVRKPKGAPPGLVRVVEADTLTVSMDPGRPT